jgi:hypothetical protein
MAEEQDTTERLVEELHKANDEAVEATQKAAEALEKERAQADEAEVEEAPQEPQAEQADEPEAEVEAPRHHRRRAAKESAE